MKPGLVVILGVLLTAAGFCSEKNSTTTGIRIITSLGAIEVKLDPVHAPATVANFLRHVDAGHYSGGQFHRTVTSQPDNQPNNAVKIDVIQAGANATPSGPNWPPVALERTSVTGLSHRNGTVSMARAGPDTATADFFICIGEQPELDFGGRRNPDGQGFAAFGQVVRGMEIVKRIHRSKAGGQALTPPIRIERIERITEAN